MFRRRMMLAITLLPGVGLLSQTTPQGTQHARTAAITLDVVVTGKDGIPVGGLTQQDFVLKDNQGSPAIRQFRAVRAGETPAEAILVVDAVNVDFIKLADERIRVERFLKANELLPVPTALAVFTDHGLELQEGYSNSGKELSQALDHFVTGIRTTRRSSEDQAQDRFNLSITALSQLVARESQRPGRKLLIWVSPGWPLLSGPRIDLSGRQQDEIFRDIVRLTTQMLQGRITLYSVNPLGVEENVEREFYYREFLKGVSKPGQAEVGDLALQVLATQSGGLVLDSSNDLEKELKTCFADINASYVISFESAMGDSANVYHHLEVSVAKPGLSARAKDAYYAQP